MTVGRARLLAGWGQAVSTAAEVVTPRDATEAARLVRLASAAHRPILGRGLGRAYGDAAQNAGGLVVDLTGCSQLLEADEDAGVVRAEAGLSLDDLLRWSVPRGWFLPVTPGTRHVTLGGALAADVHGKNHHCDGTIARYVRSARVATPTGVVEARPDGDAALFWATAGGMGLTGLVLEVTLELLAVETAYMVVDTERAADLEECMALMSQGDAAYRYSVAWVDCLKRGSGLGRGVLTRANHATAAELAGSGRGGGLRERLRPAPRAGSHAEGLAYGPRQLVEVPFTPPARLASRPVVAAFNEMWFRKAPRRRLGELQQVAAYFYPLDGVGSWNRLYGPRGFTQYQFTVPFGAEAVVREVIETLADRQMPSLLAVLKRFGPEDPGPLSFPRAGWTLALDLPLDLPGLAAELDRFDELVVESGGAVYLAKDGRLRPELVGAMYPRLAEWQAVRERFDPEGLVRSDLGRRLHLCGDGARSAAASDHGGGAVRRHPAQNEKGPTT